MTVRKGVTRQWWELESKRPHTTQLCPTGSLSVQGKATSVAFIVHSDAQSIVA